MSDLRLLASVAFAGAMLASGGGAQAAAVFDTPAGLVGDQTWGGTLGLDFTVNAKVSVNSLGAFDSGGGVISGNVYTAIFNAAGVAVTPIVDFSGLSSASNSAYAFQSITRVTLTPGQYQVASWGYSASNPNYNSYGGYPGAIAFNALGGALRADGASFSMPSAAGTLGTIPDAGVTRYGAGTFTASPLAPPPPPPPPNPPGPRIYNAAPGLNGNQSWGGTLGLNFVVTRPILLKDLGAFDASGTGIVGDVKTVIFNAAGQAVTPTLDFKGVADPTGAAYVYQSIGAPVYLSPGDYQLASWGYSDADMDYNTYGNSPSPITFNTLGGSVEAVGSAYSSAADAGQFATIAEVGAMRYGAGSMIAVGVPEPGAWALMIVGLGGLGMALRTRRPALQTA